VISTPRLTVMPRSRSASSSKVSVLGLTVDEHEGKAVPHSREVKPPEHPAVMVKVEGLHPPTSREHAFRHSAGLQKLHRAWVDPEGLGGARGLQPPFDDARRQAALGQEEAGGQACRTRADYQRTSGPGRGQPVCGLVSAHDRGAHCK
jgi:hypothetical protein